MSEIVVSGPTFKSDLFSSKPLKQYGEAAGLPSIDEVGIEDEMQHETWPVEPSARRAARHLLGAEAEATWGVVSYGYTVYRALLDEPQIPQAVYLDPRCFLPETNLLDVLEETAKCAVDDQNTEFVAPIVIGMLDTARIGNFAGDTLRKYATTVLHLGSADAIYAYVDFMLSNTVKSREDSKVFLKSMAHTIQGLPKQDARRNTGLSQLDKQILLENIGHAWIRDAMPIAEIDWLP